MRFYYLIVRNILVIPPIIRKLRRLTENNVSESECYAYLQRIVRRIKRTGLIRTKVYGTENLPKEGGYVMYPNHQGKYDAYGVVYGHEAPCTVVMDKARSYFPFIRDLLDMIRAKRLDKKDPRQALGIINQVADEVKQGRRYIIFPEGGYDKVKKNALYEFKTGCFRASLKSQTPIVPVVLIDSYKAMDSFVIGCVTTQVHFLPAIPYEEYKDMKSAQIAQLVKDRIYEKIRELKKVSC